MKLVAITTLLVRLRLCITTNDSIFTGRVIWSFTLSLLWHWLKHKCSLYFSLCVSHCTDSFYVWLNRYYHKDALSLSLCSRRCDKTIRSPPVLTRIVSPHIAETNKRNLMWVKHKNETFPILKKFSGIMFQCHRVTSCGLLESRVRTHN